MKAEVMLDALSDERWRWIVQGKIEGQERDIRDGLANAEERGMMKKAIENARNFLAMKVLSYEQIAKGVGLPLEKIEELAAELSDCQTK